LQVQFQFGAVANAATRILTGVQLEKGSTATSFDYRPYGTELALCQRYYEISNGTMLAAGAINATVGYFAFSPTFQVAKRANPTLTKVDGAATTTQGGANLSGFYFYTTSTTQAIQSSWTASSEL
jgi:hypothetical protein